jgi:hypothetical protein
VCVCVCVCVCVSVWCVWPKSHVLYIVFTVTELAVTRLASLEKETQTSQHVFSMLGGLECDRIKGLMICFFGVCCPCVYRTIKCTLFNHFLH